MLIFPDNRITRSEIEGNARHGFELPGRFAMCMVINFPEIFSVCKKRINEGAFMGYARFRTSFDRAINSKSSFLEI